MSKKQQKTSVVVSAETLPAKTAILVLGMHRSGTSALTRVLNLVGCALPKATIRADENNTAGYWEPVSINTLDDQLLAAAGSGWDDWRPLDLSHVQPTVLKDFANRIGVIMSREFDDNQLVVIKDPRIARLTDFYVSTLAANGYRSLCVIPFREPAAVIKSLAKRDGMTTDYAAVMWLRHILAAESATRTLPRSFVKFEALMQNWRSVIVKTEADIGVSWPRKVDDAAPEIDAFLNADLWHHREQEIAGSPSILRWLESATMALNALAKDPLDHPAMESLDRLAAELLVSEPVIERAVLSELSGLKKALHRSAIDVKNLEKTEATLASVSKLVASAQSDVRVSEEQAEQLRQQLAEREAALASRTASLHELERTFSIKSEEARLLASRQAEMDGRIDEFRQGAKERDRVISALREELEGLTSNIADLGTERDRHRADLEESRSDLAKLQTKLARSSSELSSLNSELTLTKSELASSRAENSKLESEIVNLESKLDRSKSELSKSNANLARTKSALSEAELRLISLDAESKAKAGDHAKELAAAKRRHETLQRQIQDRDNIINGLDADIDFIRGQLDSETQALADEVRGREHEVSQLVADHGIAWDKVRESHSHNLALQEHLDQAEDRIRMMESSFGWRMTSPARTFRRWRRQTRQLLGESISILNLHQLEPLQRDDGFSQWRMTGTDPNFELVWSSTDPLTPGHYLMAFEAPETIAALADPKLYVDTGNGYSEAEAILLRPFGRDERFFKAAFSLPNGARSLRFDPSIRPGNLVIGPISLRRLTRAQFYSHLSRRVLKTRQQLDGSMWPTVRRGMAEIRNRGLRGSVDALRSTAQRLADSGWGAGGRQRQFLPDVANYVPITDEPPLEDPPVTLICFYLPQFHPIKQNDEWWGEGFTEWTNVRPAQPQFEHHYQPHVPDMLGYYDLRNVEVQLKQIELAKLYGVGGFCFYFYWFAGERLLETPTLNYLKEPSLDFPFCLCWANENWSRRWDGKDSEILIGQDHSAQDDLDFIAYVAQYLQDPRYIRVQGKPLLLVYRPSLLPDPAETAQRWREWCRDNGLGEIYLAYTQSFEMNDPTEYGFDAAIEFPPNNSSPPSIADSVIPLHAEFEAKVYDWTIFPERSRNYLEPTYTLFRSVTPAWDNTARRKTRGTVFANSTPALFGEWLGNAIEDTRKRFSNRDERLVFINAWNEWAEGAHLEPDQRYGFAYLDATRSALARATMHRSRKLVLVSHDAHPHGAQLLAMNMARTFGDLGFAVDLIVLGDGPLMDRFREVATIHRIDLDIEPVAETQMRLQKLREAGAEVAIVNTTVSGPLTPLLKQAGFQTVSLIHELPGILESYDLSAHAHAIANNADTIVFPDALVRDGFETFIGKSVPQAVVRPQGTYLKSPYRFAEDREPVRRKVRQKLGLSNNARIVMCAGYGDRRKGLDLFVGALLDIMKRKQNRDVVGLWVGHCDSALLEQQQARIRAAGLEGRFIFTGFVKEPQDYYAAADIYALTSREDPFPSVVMESFDAHIPVVAFEGAGGFATLLRRGCGILVPGFSEHLFAEALSELLGNSARARELADTGHNIVVREYDFRHYLFDLLAFAEKPLPKVSVIVPNYNYERYITSRLDSVVNQTIPVYELIVLDDSSTDRSVSVIRDYLAHCPVSATLVANQENSGSVFAQWTRGVDMARGDLVWIAEADDLADPEFLEHLISNFDDPEVVMAYSQSRMIDGEGNVTANDYLSYVADIDKTRWTEAFVASGQDEVATAMFIKNAIPNVSAVVFRRDVLQATLRDCFDEITAYRNAGDWVAYLRLMEKGKVAFHPQSLNSHRRHRSSVTISGFNIRQLKEIIDVQRDTIERFGLDDDARAAADAYAQRLFEQFGLATPDSPHFQNHPDLASPKN